MINLAGLELKNPIMTASGTAGYGRELANLVDLDSLGAFVVKGTSLEPWVGNPPIRVAETASGMLNSIGLQNPGVGHFISYDLPFLRQFSVPVIVNIVGRSVDEYALLAKRLKDMEGIAALEVNVSCPNVKEGGLSFGQDPLLVKEVTEAVRENWDKPLIVKLSPNVTNIVEIGRAAKEGGADVLSLINTLRGMAIDTNSGRPVLAQGIGGLSGPAIKPVALRMVFELASELDIPLIGMGGIQSYRDVLEFMMAGASAVAIGTAVLRTPGMLIELVRELEYWRLSNGVAWEDIIGLTVRGEYGEFR